MSRFNFLNPAAEVLAAGRVDDDIATVARALRAKPNRRKQMAGADEVAVLGTTPAGHELRANTTKQGIEIKFASKPDETTLAALKAAGWKWSRFSSVWYARDTAEARAWAKNFLAQFSAQFSDGAPTATPPTPPTTVAAPLPVAPAPSAAFVSTTRSVVILDNPPPGGWTEADRVPNEHRRPWNQITPPAPVLAPLGLPKRPLPFAKK